MALSLSTLLPSSAPENLKTTVAMSTLASSGVKVKVSSSFCLGPSVPKRFVKSARKEFNINKMKKGSNMAAFKNKTVGSNLPERGDIWKGQLSVYISNLTKPEL